MTQMSQSQSVWAPSAPACPRGGLVRRGESLTLGAGRWPGVSQAGLTLCSVLWVTVIAIHKCPPAERLLVPTPAPVSWCP